MFSASKTAAASTGGFTIANSLRFRSSASAYLSRTPASASSRTTLTFSAWIKLGSLATGDSQNFLTAGTSFGTNNNDLSRIFFSTANKLSVVGEIGGSTQYSLVTTQVFRDPSSWYHVVVAFDTTQATSSNRIKVYVNGTQITAFDTATYPSQNNSTYYNAANLHKISGGTAASYFDGYLTEINFIDGQALTPSSFGETGTTTGVWIPKKYTGTYGTNGFYLNFSNGTSTTTLGYDSSSNGNNWTTNNISLTSGATYDWMIDSPTSYAGTSYGTGNYSVFNPLDKGSDVTVADANLSLSWGGVNGHSIRDSIAMSAGQWYCELTMGTSSVTMGLIAQNISGVGSFSGWPGSSPFGVGGSYGYANSGNKYTNSVSSAYGASYTTGDVIGIAFDATAGTLAFYKNGSSQGTAFTGISGSYCFAIGYFGGSTGGTPAYANFGQRPFAYTPPTGYKALNTQNLPTPSIQNGSNFMAATLYTGTGSAQNIINANNGVSFQPDFVWQKCRSAAYNHGVNDSVRGAGKFLYPNLTDAEGNYPTDFSGFLSNGFSLGTGTGQVTNANGATYVAWQWKAGGTAVTNTAGSITSQVSANTTSGFAVVTYTGTGANATVGHGLGVAPSMIIFKSRNTSGTSWDTYHVALGATKYLFLDSTTAAGTSSWLNNTAPSSSVITLSNFGDSNASGSTYVAYCFAAIAGYSAFGSYTGNGSADGPFVNLGFRPRYVLIKRTDSTADWTVWDTSRNTYNVSTVVLCPNLSSAESSFISGYEFDILSNGFKCRSIGNVENASGGTYIYAAFAESPFSLSLAR